ncbi:MAG: class I SAM-dependent methyltransferase [Oscillospiraceae bacterium]|jgi:23S rRNA (cytosine1962-C5)-methyltransferase|nr:class I SAM-dependent methyltransferase [Oscillospiraceae bacterium]
MRIAENWKDYELIDCSQGERLERWGNVVLIRPDPQVIWSTPRNHRLWKAADARYFRSQSGGGKWEVYKKIPDRWPIAYNSCTFHIKTMGFKHTGLFPEQASNWDFTAQKIKEAGRPLKMLNLFAYTGGATVSALAAGASVTHVDAAKGMVLWAKENARDSGVLEKGVRWIVDDCIKFVEREKRRGSQYDIILMDPPSYGRGPGGEVWKLEDEVYRFCEACAGLLSDKPVLFMVNSYTAGLSPAVIQYILSYVMKHKGGTVAASELGLRVSETGLVLPCGSTAYWTQD